MVTYSTCPTPGLHSGSQWQHCYHCANSPEKPSESTEAA